MGFLTAFGALFGLSGRVATAVGGLLTLIIVVGILYGVKSCYDSSVVEEARRANNERAIILKQRADEHAAEARREDQVRAITEAEQLKETVDEAVEEGRDPRAAYYQCIRLQQQARAAGRPAPAC